MNITWSNMPKLNKKICRIRKLSKSQKKELKDIIIKNYQHNKITIIILIIQYIPIKITIKIYKSLILKIIMNNIATKLER